MAVDTSYTPELLIYRLQEWPSDNEQMKVRRELVEARNLLSHTSVLIDLRGISGLLPSDGLTERSLAGFQGAAGSSRCAIIVSSREHETFVDNLKSVSSHPLFVKPFHDEEEAIAWLLAQSRAFQLDLLE
jgi:hypothetical protein